MKKPLKYWKNKAIDLAKKITTSKGRCEKCDRSAMAGWTMHGAHIMPVTYVNTAADLDNLMCLCSRCHVFSSDSWHQSPLENAEWFDEKYPGKYQELRERARLFHKWTAAEWEDKYNELKEHYENDL